MVRFVRLAAICAVSSLAFACGPTRSSTRIVEASAELSAAQTAQADKASPYEYTAAKEYLAKAREEESYSEFEVAANLAAKSRDCAKLSRLRAEMTARTELGAGQVTIPRNLKCRPGPRIAGEREPQVPRTRREAAPPPTPAPPPKKAPVVPDESEPEPPAGEDDAPQSRSLQ